MQLKFGTDGWRALIAEDFTYANVAGLTHAFAAHHRASLKKLSLASVALGYDRRFLSEPCAELIGQTLQSYGFRVLASQDFCPTPAVAFYARKHQAIAGIMVTASHNPYLWNGIKFKAPDGGAIDMDYAQALEEQFKRWQAKGKLPRRASSTIVRPKIQLWDAHQAYSKHLARPIDMQAIRRSKLKVLFDPMYGAGSGFLSPLLGEQIHEIRGETRFDFGGINPEPIEANLDSTREQLIQLGADVALATDGDADRLGALDEQGRFVSSQQIFALLLKHLVDTRGLRGTVVKTVSTTQMIDRLAARYQLKLRETPIGFKHICRVFREEPCLIGGEESGGLGIPLHLPERDGLFAGLLLLETLALARKPLSRLVEELQQELGPCYFERLDLKLKNLNLKKTLAQLKYFTPKLSKTSLTARSHMDGLKYHFEDSSWLLIRSSGTEPMLRLYAEASTPSRARQLLRQAEELVQSSES